jgi:hypothetical protein
MGSRSNHAGQLVGWSKREQLTLLVLVPIAAALVGAWLIPVPHAWGWDESMHAEEPAVRMLLALEGGRFAPFFRVLHGCQQYPFGWPLVLLGFQALFGVGEIVARAAGWAAFALLLALLALTGRAIEVECASGPNPISTRRLAPLFALLTPLLLAFAPTLFLEVPSALALLATFYVWLAAQRASTPARAALLSLLASARAMLAFFTKFNYALLFVIGLALDLALRLATCRMSERGWRLRAALWLLPVPLAALAWWFVLPLPFGAEIAHSHRAAFLGFLLGNLELAATPWTTRALHLCGYLAGSPLQALVLGLGLAASLCALRHRALRSAWIVLLALELPVLLHPFHLERFLIPGAPFLLLLSAYGCSRLVERGSVARWCLLAALLLGYVSAPLQLERLAAALGVLPSDPAAKAWAREVFAGWVHPDLRRRNVPTAGLQREELSALLDLLAPAIGSAERVGWPAVPSEVSPLALQLGLVERGRSRAHLSYGGLGDHAKADFDLLTPHRR